MSLSDACAADGPCIATRERKLPRATIEMTKTTVTATTTTTTTTTTTRQSGNADADELEHRNTVNESDSAVSLKAA